MIIKDHWKLRDFRIGEARDLEVASPLFDDYFWMASEVPGDVHTTLIRHGLIDDPFYGHNDQKCRWVEDRIWWYRTVFTLDEVPGPNERMELVFEGLDTFATVYLNGAELGSTDNMFISHTFEVSRELKPGKNVIAVKFDPVHAKVGEKAVSTYWSGFSKERVWTRKNQSHYGWDWGPRLLCAGIWKEVRLEKSRHAKLEHVYARTAEIGTDQALVDVSLEIKAWDCKKTYTAFVELIDEEKGEAVASAEFKVDLSQGFMMDGASIGTRMTGSTRLEVAQPKLWWTHDLGTPFLYKLQITVSADGEAIDSRSQMFGVRSLELKLRDDSGNPTFTFVLNDVPVFAKGANWIPIDSFIAAVPDSRYSRLIRMAQGGNMNMLRVWGGGIYERDIFYDECDRLGILVWQDFMFACALYPDYNRNFMDNVRREIEHVTKRLRSRTCLALWCGNNENDWLYEALHSSGQIPHPFYGEKIYHEMMPALLEKLDPSRTFWPSSPFGGNDHNSRDEGDTHNWQVWHGNIEPRVFGEPQLQDYSIEGLSFKKFKEDHTKFASEFGMHASSTLYTLKRNIPESELVWGSTEMMNRNKDINHLKGIMLMEGYSGIPSNLEEYVNFSMLTQAEGLKYGIEHYRRNKPETSGALFWQFNDCWPGTSWSVIDYYGLPKAAYHYARKFFHPVLLTAEYTPGDSRLILWGLNDTRQTAKRTAEIKVYGIDGRCVYHRSYPVTIDAVGKQRIADITLEELLQDLDPSQAVCVIRWEYGTGEDNFYYFLDHKDMNFEPTRLNVQVNPQDSTVTVSAAGHLARMVKLELDAEWIEWEDNYFDLLPGQSRTLHVKQLEGKDIPWYTLRVSALNGTAN
ncbi:beta galactosidase jelly roll domain-containing protein [Paenibacillus sp. KQZ6P-2]|uniref:Beta-mannosidase B n=1 Tax=Paenibacillus mangrovi TaxID=2931978 RepID=A0A9X1WMT1_9BACL|nr:glycoside hydrolase family 2 protein [Paenibacillus mangrovi]MCJ8012157.1 beta galactosidase jelly roll domain-containing protein [Paenibacillus mangrovi]